MLATTRTRLRIEEWLCQPQGFGELGSGACLAYRIVMAGVRWPRIFRSRANGRPAMTQWTAAPGLRPSGGRVLRDLRKAGWIVLEVWVAEPDYREHARRGYSAAQAYCTESGREALELIGG